ncbi:MAG: type II secretion system protein GspK [Desulfobacteraceae bacterium]|nr:type II secretion system protein GspK [Desulfobacteraceae bacterium]
MIGYLRRLGISSFAPSPASEKGVILIAALWISTLVMWFAFQISAETRFQSEETILSMRKSEAYHFAIGGCYEAIARMGQPPPMRTDMPLDFNWQPDGKPRVVDYRTGAALVIVDVEESRVNVNKAPQLQLRQLIEKAGVDEAFSETLADRILDFIDQDDSPRLQGMEKDAYRTAGLNWVPFDGPFTSLDQLLLVPGITQQLFYGYEGSANDGTADLPEMFRDCLIPGRYSLFSMLTIYGKNTNPLGFLERNPVEILVSWKTGTTYRILSFGKSFNGPPAVGVMLIVRFSPDGRSPYQVLSRRVF